MSYFALKKVLILTHLRQNNYFTNEDLVKKKKGNLLKH